MMRETRKNRKSSHARPRGKKWGKEGWFARRTRVQRRLGTKARFRHPH